MLFKMQDWPTTLFEAGDFFGTRGTGALGFACRNLITPPTDRVHFGFLWFPLKDGDWVTLESTAPKGMFPGKLSWYNKTDIQFYRAICTPEMRHQAPDAALDMARSLYDFLLIAGFTIEGLSIITKRLIATRRFKPVGYKEFHYSANLIPICTEVVVTGYDMIGYHLVDPGVAPTPNALRAAQIEGRFYEIVTPVQLSSIRPRQMTQKALYTNWTE